MNSKPSSDDVPSDRDEAALWWAARRMEAGGMSAEDQEALQTWLNVSPENQAALEEAEKSVDCFIQEKFFDSREVQNLRTEPSADTKRARFIRFAPFASAAAIIVVALILFLSSSVENHYAEVGEARELGLEDGTQVLLAPGSLLEVAFTEEIREVRLIQGAAVFDIAPEDRAFLAKAGDYEIRDIGTVFAVELRSEISGRELQVAGLEVEVREGAVEIVNTAVEAATPTLIEEGETTVWTKPEIAPEVEVFSVEDFADWQSGFLNYRNRSLAAVLADLGRAYELEIRMEDPALGQETITGTIPANDLEDAIGLLETLLPIELEPIGSDSYRVVRMP